MRALVFDRRLFFANAYPPPAAAPGESIVRVALAGICGTDLEIERGYLSFRGVPGHEFVGRVAETASRVLAGRRVVGEINAACGACELCAAGLGRHCPNRTVLGIAGRDGAFAELLRLPDENLVPLPDSIPDELAVFTEPIAAAYEIFEQLNIPRDAAIAVLGGGRLGAIVALALRGEGYAPVIAGHHASKLERLAALGLSTADESGLRGQFDYVIDCTGAGSGFARALDLTAPRGTIVLKSTAAAGAALNLAPLVVNEIRVLGSRCGRFAPALAAMEAKKIDPRPLIDATFALDDGVAAFAAAAKPPNFKILLRPA
jgi:threonine dehydrogenase-like Zn-dependent dehydrogenase